MFNEREHPRDNDGKFTDGSGTSGGKKSHSEFMEELRQSEREKFSKKEKAFSENIDDILNGKYKDSHITLNKETPIIFQKVGVPNKPMLMTSKHAYLVMNKDGKYNGEDDHYHDLGKDLFLNLPKFLEKPILGFQSKHNKDDIITIINAIDKKGNPVMVPVRINGTGSENHIIVEANIIKTAYGRNNIDKYLADNLTEENLLFVENKKIRNLRK